jgi:hypothetical protein
MKTIRKVTLNFYHDPGHGWVKVSKSLLKALGEEVYGKITSYSYERNDSVYLEQDCDAGKVLHALESKGIKFKFINHSTDKQSKIRSYNRYSKFSFSGEYELN